MVSIAHRLKYTFEVIGLNNRIDNYFDRDFYLDKYPDVANSNVDPLRHYKIHGWREKRWPTAWFDPEEYMSKFPGKMRWRNDPFDHFVRNEDPEKVFLDYLWAKPAVSSDKNTQIVDKDIYNVISPPKSDMDLVKPFFDSAFYLKNYPDVEQYRIDPLLHFMVIGWVEGKDPSSDFSVRRYLIDYPDIRRARINPFLHYCKHGRYEKFRRVVGHVEGKILDEIENNEKIQSAIREAIKLEPLVALPDKKKDIIVITKTRAKLAKAARKLRLNFSAKQYNLVLFLPALNSFEVAKENISICNSIASSLQEEILVFCSEIDQINYNDMFSSNCILFDVWKLISDVERHDHTKLIYDVLRGVNAKIVFNMYDKLPNSLIEDYGRQLYQEFKVISYLSSSGNDIKCFDLWLRKTCHFHHSILTSNDELSSKVINQFSYNDGFCCVKTFAEFRELDNADLSYLLPPDGQ